MDLIRIEIKDADRLAPLVAGFRSTLLSYRGVEAQPDLASAKEEIADFIRRGYPVYAVEDREAFAGYMVCRIDEPCLWVEHLFVCEEYRRKGVATMLFDRAEALAGSMGEDTVYNFVHPNNEGMIRFLRSKGYTVLNMIEIRKPYQGEKLTTTVRVGDEAFDY